MTTAINRLHDMSGSLTRSFALKSNCLVLLVEDNETNRLVIQQQLKLLNYYTDIATNGHEALALWRHSQYALILCDLHMPQMDGYQLVAAIRQQEQQFERPRTPIIALTANALSAEVQRCKAIGMDECLSKPMPLAQLGMALEQWIRPARVSDMDLPDPLLQDDRAVAQDASHRLHAVSVDFSVLQSVVKNDAVLMAKVLSEYIQSLSLSKEIIRNAGGEQQWNALCDRAHQLKSASRFLGAQRLGALLDSLEHASREQDESTVNRLMPQVYYEIQKVLDHLVARYPEHLPTAAQSSTAYPTQN